MKQEIVALVSKQLASQPFVRLQSITHAISGSPIAEISKILLEAASLQQAELDIILAVALQRQAAVVIQYEKLSNIAQGFLVYENANFEQKIEIKREQLRDLKIVGVSRKQCPISDIKNAMMTLPLQKKHRYINKQILSLKKNTLVQISVKPSEDAQIKKSLKPSQPLKVDPKTLQKSENVVKQPNCQEPKLKPLQKKSSKEMQEGKPVQNLLKKLLNSQTQDTVQEMKQKVKLSQERRQKAEPKTKAGQEAAQKEKPSQEMRQLIKRTPKMKIQSDEQQNDRSRINQKMDIEQEKAKETQSSDKKKADQDLGHPEKQKPTTSKFIADDDDDDDDYEELMLKMCQATKKPTTPPPTPQIQQPGHPATTASQPQIPQKPMQKAQGSQPAKVQNQHKKEVPVSSNAPKGGLLKWLTSK